MSRIKPLCESLGRALQSISLRPLKPQSLPLPALRFLLLPLLFYRWLFVKPPSFNLFQDPVTLHGSLMGEYRMVTLLTALVSLVDKWKQHVGPGVPVAHVIGGIDSALSVQIVDMTSDSPTRRIVSVIESTLSAHCNTAVDAAEDYAELYGTRKNLVAETTLETFLSDVWPKAPRPNRHTRTRTTVRLG